MSLRWRQWFLRTRTILVAVVRKFFADNGLILSSALAFNLLLYFIPLSLLMVSLLGYTVLDSERAMREVQSVLLASLPRSQEAFAKNVATIVADRGLLGFAGLASFMIFSTFLFGSVRTVLNQVFQARHERSFMRGVGIDALMTLSIAVLVLLMMGATGFLALTDAFVERYPNWIGFVQPGLDIFNKGFGMAVTACLFYILYRFAPAITISSRALVVASITATLLFQIAKWGFGWYVTIAQQNVELYGALTGVIFLFVWLYYASVLFIIGAEIGWTFDQERTKIAAASNLL